jgi:hypothetical protein
MHAGDDVDFAAPPIGQTDAPVIDRFMELGSDEERNESWLT